jgi:SAM-dependent methyltransferase
MNREFADPHADPHFASKNPVLLRIWDNLQRWQTEFCFAQELTAYYTSDLWHKAQRVLDVGTGNGYYLQKLAKVFPAKSYLGIDSSPEFIHIAQRERTLSNITFRHLDLFDLDGQFDFLIVRLLLQHLPEAGAALQRLRALTRPGGAALIIDACDPTRYFHPPVDAFMAFFQAYREHESGKSRNRDAALQLRNDSSLCSGWTVGPTLQLLIPSTIGDNLSLFKKTYGTVIDMVEEAGELSYNFEDVRREWARWCGDDRAYTQVGLILTQLERD